MYYIRSMLRNCTGVTFTFRRFPDNFRSHSTQPEEEKSEKKRRDRGGNGKIRMLSGNDNHDRSR